MHEVLIAWAGLAKRFLLYVPGHLVTVIVGLALLGIVLSNTVFVSRRTIAYIINLTFDVAALAFLIWSHYYA